MRPSTLFQVALHLGLLGQKSSYLLLSEGPTDPPLSHLIFQVGTIIQNPSRQVIHALHNIKAKCDGHYKKEHYQITKSGRKEVNTGDKRFFRHCDIFATSPKEGGHLGIVPSTPLALAVSVPPNEECTKGRKGATGTSNSDTNAVWPSPWPPSPWSPKLSSPTSRSASSFSSLTA